MRRVTPVASVPAGLVVASLVLAGPLSAPAAPASSPAPSSQVAVSGRILLPGGAPAAGIEVELLPQLDLYEFGLLVLAGQVLPEPLRMARTGLDGTFRLDAPDIGIWQLRVAPEGYRPMGLFLLALLEPRQVPPLELTAERTVEIRVNGPDGAPLADARVVAEPPPADRRSGQIAWQASRRRALADPSGVARLGRGPDESLRLFAFAPGHLEAERSDVRRGSISISMTPATPRPLRISTAGGAPVERALVRIGERHWRLGLTDDQGLLRVPTPESGEVLLQAIDASGRRAQELVELENWSVEEPLQVTLAEPTPWRGSVLDHTTRRPLPGAFVWRAGQPFDFVVTDANGVYSLPGPQAGGFWVWAAARGHLVEAQRTESAEKGGPTFSLQAAVRVSGFAVDAEERPVADAEVTVEVDYTSRRAANRWASHQLDSGVSDLQGRFSIGRLYPDASYVIRVAKRGFAPSYLPLPHPENTAATPLRVVLNRGHLAVGTVVDVSGAPVPGALVELSETVPSNTPRAMFEAARQDSSVIEAFSDSEGRFAMVDLAPGEFELRASARGYAPTLVSSLEGLETESGTSIGEVTLMPGFSIEGRVEDFRGSPVEGAAIYATETTDRGRFRSFQGRRAGEPVTTTDANGLFTVEDRREGERVDLAVEAPGFASGHLAGVEAPTYEPVTIRLHRASKVSGTVVDGSGRGVPEAFVHVQSEATLSSMRRSGRGRGATTDADGNFVVEEVAPGQIMLMVNAIGFREAQLTHLIVEPEQDLEGVRVELEAGASITGRITGPTGQPIAQASVMKRDTARGGMSYSGTASDADGKYRLDGVEVGTRTIVVQHQDYATVTRQIDVQMGENTLDIALEGGATVSGRVVAEDGEPIPGARINMFPHSTDRWMEGHEGISDTSGGFEIRGLSEGDYSVQIHKDGFAPARSADLEVGAGGLAGLEFRLGKGAAITGRLTGLEASAYSTVEIYAGSELGYNGEGHGRTDGTYRIDDLAPATYDVVASAGGRSARGRVTVGPGVEEVGLDLEFKEGITLSGQVLKRSEPLAGVYVFASGLDVSSQGHTRTDSEGRFRLRGLEPGRHSLRVNNHFTGLDHQEEIDLDTDREIVVRIAAAQVEGVVLDATDYEPIVGARVSIASSEAPSSIGYHQRYDQSTDSAGHFRFAEAGAGDYRLIASADGYAPVESGLTILDGVDQDGLEVLLSPTEGILVVVTLPSGEPASGFRAAALDPSGRLLTADEYLTDADGSARLSLPPGRWQLRVGTHSSAVASVEVEVPGDPVVVRLAEGAQLTLRVPELEEDKALATLRLTGPDGRPHVGVQELWGRPEPRVVHGRAQLSGLPPGSYTVVVEASDGRAWQAQVTLGAGENPELVLK